MNKQGLVRWSGLFSLVVGCASPPSADSADSAKEDPAPWEAIAPEEPTPRSDASADADATEPEDTEGTSAPEFRPGMSVIEATNAVPSSTQRLNIEQEALAAPLMEPKLYEPCGLEGHHHFKLKVAVWDGRAVGLDVSTQPNDAKLESCLRQQISEVEWKDKAKSINTVEYSY